ncbi:MAG: hypothetical protein AAF618_04565 [Pseudomonadota bacterium]
MELFLISAPLIGALISGPLGQAIGEKAASYVALALGLFAALLAVLVAVRYAAGEGPYTVFLAGWLESGTLTGELALYVDGLGVAVAAFASTLIALFQVHAVTLKALPGEEKPGEGRRMRLQNALSFLHFAALLVLFAGGLVVFGAALLVLALALCLAMDFHFLSKNASKSAGRALLFALVAAAALLVLTAALFVQDDADALETLFDLAAPLSAVPWLAAIAAFALAGLLPFSPWLTDASEAPAELAAALFSLMAALAVFVILRFAPWGGLESPLAAWLALLTAVLGALMALGQDFIRRSLAAASLVPSGLAVALALAGQGTQALAIVASFAAGYALLWLSYGAVARRLPPSQETKALGGLRSHFPAAHLGAFFGTLAVSGFGLPVLYLGVPTGLAPFMAQNAALGALEGAFYWGAVAALFLQSLALWRLYLVVFQGQPRSKKLAASLPHVGRAPALARAVLAIFALILAAGGGFLAPFLPTAAAVSAVPLMASIGGLLAALALKRSLGAAPVRASGAPLSLVLRGFEDGLGVVTDRTGTFIADRLDRSLFDALFDPLSRWLLPKLDRSAGQAQTARAFPIILGFVIAGLLILTVVTMAGA